MNACNNLNSTFSVNFYINFYTAHTGGVAFTFSVQQETLSAGGQVAIAFLILVLVYLLIGLEVGVGRCGEAGGVGRCVWRLKVWGGWRCVEAGGVGRLEVCGGWRCGEAGGVGRLEVWGG